MARWQVRIAVLSLFFIFTILVNTGLAQAKVLGAVATQHPLATQSAVRILQQGGNAFDAAIAAALTLAVVEPYNSGLGAGGLALLWDAQRKKAIALDFREMAPDLASPKMFQQSGVTVDASQNGPLAIAVPGEVAGLGSLHQKLGYLPWALLFKDAIRYAEQGFATDNTLINRARSRQSCLSRDYHTWKLYRPLFPNKSDLEADEFHEEEKVESNLFWTQPGLAKTLKRLQSKGAQDFYTGETAYKIVSNLKGKGALLRLADLKKYQVKERLPLSTRFAWGQVWGFPLPSSGGISVLRGLNTMKALEKKTGKKSQWIPWLVQVFGQIFETRNQVMGDSDFIRGLPFRRWISKPFARSQAQNILRKKTVGNNIKTQTPKTNGQTTHLSVMDAQGNAVAITLTQNLSFGSCVTAGDTGILMNNQMDDFSTQAGKANAFGLVQSQNNAIAGGKRPLSSMSPTLVTQKQQAILAIGSPGGPRIITTILQVLYNHFFLGVELKQAIANPRFHYQGTPNRILYENHLGEGTQNHLKALKLPLHSSRAWGNVQAVAWDPTTHSFSAESDPRRQGQSIIVHSRK